MTGIICASDVLALGAIRAVRRSGLSVPGDVSVVGYDDSAWLNSTDPPLTTVRQPIEAMGKAAVALLVNQMESVSVYPEELLFEPELVVRVPLARHAAHAEPARWASRSQRADSDAGLTVAGVLAGTCRVVAYWPSSVARNCCQVFEPAVCPGGGSRAPLRSARVPGIRTGNTNRRRLLAFR